MNPEESGESLKRPVAGVRRLGNLSINMVDRSRRLSAAVRIESNQVSGVSVQVSDYMFLSPDT